MSDKPINVEEVNRHISNGASKAKSYVLRNINMLVCFLIVAAVIVYKMSKVMFVENEDPLLAIMDSAIMYVMCMIVYFNMHWQYQKKTMEGDSYISAKRRHAIVVGTIDAAGFLDGINDFCRDYPLEELKNYRVQILKAVGLTYEQFEGTPAADEDLPEIKGYKDMSRDDIKALQVTKNQRKAIRIAVDASPKKLSFDLLISGRDNKKRGDNFVRGGKSKATKRDATWRIVRYAVMLSGLSWYSQKFALAFSWEGVTDLLTAVAVIAVTAFSGIRGGIDAINEHEVNRIHDQCDVLSVYCARKNIKLIDAKTEP